MISNYPPGVTGREQQINPSIDIEETEIHTWFERDRQHVELRRIHDDHTLVEWWDNDVTEAVEDGFLDTRDFHQSAYDYAIWVGII